MKQNGWRDLGSWLTALWHEWKKLVSAFTFLVGLLTEIIPQVRSSPFQPIIAPFLISASALCFLWALFSVYQDQLRRLEKLDSPVSSLGIIQIEKLLGEIEHNTKQFKDASSRPYAWRDEAWRSVSEGSLALSAPLRLKVADFYMGVRTAKEGWVTATSPAGRIRSVQGKDGLVQLANEILPELRRIVGTQHTLNT